MEEQNEVKEETKVEKKKGNGLFTLFACVMTGIIVFLATNIGYKASKVVDPDSPKGNKESNVTSNVESNTTSNVESNTTSNTPTETKLTDVEALAKGKELYTKANDNYINPLTVSRCTLISSTDAANSLYDCTTAYNTLKTIFTENNDVFKIFTLKDGKYTYTAGGTGVASSAKTTLAVKSIEAEKITLTATSVITSGDSSTETVTNDFVIVKENGSWKVLTFVYVPVNQLA